MSRAFTSEQRAAIDDRSGSRLLAANAGSGKTAVMVERFAEAVLTDGVEVPAVLALTFTEKAAGELRERVRRRFAEAGEAEHAREAESAWIGTIHGFCAGVLRAHPFAAGLDPGFTVLDEPAARRLRDEAWDVAVEGWVAAEGRPALDLLAGSTPIGARAAVEGAYAELRSRGSREPRLPLPPALAAPDPAPLLAAARAAAGALAAASGKTVDKGKAALDAAQTLLEGAAPGEVPRAGTLDGLKLAAGAKALDVDACVAYRAAWTAYGQACADFHARPAIMLLDGLLRRFAAACEARKRELAGVDFEDLQLRVRDLFATDPALLARWRDRFALIMVDEFQDTNRLQLDLLERLEADNLFAVGDEFQSIYGFRHADVTIFRERAAALGEGRVRRLRSNFRSREALLDVLDLAFTPVFGPDFQPLVAGRAPAAAPVAAPAPAALVAAGDVAAHDVADVDVAAGRLGAAGGFDDGDDGLRLFDPDHVTAAPPTPTVDRVVSATPEDRMAPATPAAVARSLPADDGSRAGTRPSGAPAVEVLITGTAGWDVRDDLGPEVPGEQPWRRAEARLIAQRLRAEVDGGRRPGEIAVLVRAAASLRPIEAALEDVGVATYVVGGRGYWSQEQVRDGLAWLAVLANPLDEEALYSVLASPFGRVGVDGLALTAQAGSVRKPDGTRVGAWAALRAAFVPAGEVVPHVEDRGGIERPVEDGADWTAALPAADREALAAVVGLLDAERGHVERLGAETLLERAIAATGYDVTILARPGGERRLANVRKLMRLAREFERAEGRDLRALLAYAAGQDVAGVREGEAALESEGLDAVRLMTIHRAKGLEFPVVCVADLGRQGRRVDDPLLVGGDGQTVGLRLRGLGDAAAAPALDWEALRDARADAEDAEERRLLYVACTRAEDTLLLSGGADLERLPAQRPGAAPLAWLLPAFLADATLVRSEPALAGEPVVVDRAWDGRPAPLALRVSTPDNGVLAPLAHRAAPAGVGTALPAPSVVSRPVAPPAAVTPAMAGLPRRLSYSALGDYGRCAYGWYLRRVLRLPAVEAPPPLVVGADLAPLDPAPGRAGEDAAAPGLAHDDAAPEGLDPRTRGSLVHTLLEDLDFRRPRSPGPEAAHALAAAWGLELTAAEAADVDRLVAAFAASPLCDRLARALRVRREAPFTFPLDAAASPDGLLVHGFVDVLATEAGGALVVDYKTDGLEGTSPEALTASDYASQRKVYALAALRSGAARVEVAHCYLERPGEPATAVYTQADAPRLAEELVGLAAGILAGRFPVTDRPHHDLCATCPGRAALCSHPPALTLRPSPR